MLLIFVEGGGWAWMLSIQVLRLYAFIAASGFRLESVLRRA